MTTQWRLTARVNAPNGNYFDIETFDSPPHLKFIQLTHRQMAGAKVGDTVKLEYQVTPRSGLWNGVEILGDKA